MITFFVVIHSYVSNDFIHIKQSLLFNLFLFIHNKFVLFIMNLFCFFFTQIEKHYIT
jgi:hypothetical protein